MKLTEILVAGMLSGVATGLVIDHFQNRATYQHKLDCNKVSDKYVVHPGDTLWSIAQAYGTTIPELARFNPKVKQDPNFIKAGEKLCVPNFSPLYNVETAPRKNYKARN